MISILLAVITLSLCSATLRSNKTPSYNQTLESRAQKPTSIPLYRTDTEEYAIEVIVGTQELRLQVDTGAFMLYLLGKGWTGPAVTTEYVRTTGRNMGEPDGAEFGSGETIEGTIWKDSFAVKDVRGVLKEQHIVVATDGNLQLDKSLTGLMGWGWPEDPFKKPIWLTYLEKFAQPQFAMYLPPGKHGQMTIGGFNPDCMADRRASSIFWVDVVIPPGQKRPAKWTITLDSVSIRKYEKVEGLLDSDSDDSSSAGGHFESAIEALVDTASGFIVMPANAAKKYYSTFLAPGSYELDEDGYSAPCAVFDDLPDLIVSIGRQTFTIPRSNLITDLEDGTCQGHVIGDDRQGRFLVLGTPFLSTVYTIFHANVRQPRIGFAELKAVNPCV